MQTDVTDLDQHARLKARLSLLEHQLEINTQLLTTERSEKRRLRAERDLYYHDLTRIIRAIEELNEAESGTLKAARGTPFDIGWIAVVAAIAALAAIAVVGAYIRLVAR